MAVKIKIELTKERQHVELVGSPHEILIEFSSLLGKQKDLAFIIKTAIKFSSVMEKDFAEY